MLCYGILIVMWCEQPPAPPPTDSFCQLYRPVRWSSRDTRESKEQIDSNNRKWVAVCRGNK